LVRKRALNSDLLMSPSSAIGANSENYCKSIL
jgi:hypothetical protein